MEQKKQIKLEQKHWIIIAIASFVLVLSLILCLAFCGKGDGNESGNGDGGEGSSQGPGGTYDEENGYTGEGGKIDDNWDTNFN